MRKVIAVLLFAFMAISAEAGIVKKSAQGAELAAHVGVAGVKAAGHGAKAAAKATAHAAKKIAHTTKKVVF